MAGTTESKDPDSPPAAGEVLYGADRTDLTLAIGIVTVGSILPLIVSTQFDHVSLYVDASEVRILVALWFLTFAWPFVYGLDLDYKSFVFAVIVVPWFAVTVTTVLLVGLGIAFENNVLMSDWLAPTHWQNTTGLTTYTGTIVYAGIVTTVLSGFIGLLSIEGEQQRHPRARSRRTFAFGVGSIAVAGLAAVTSSRLWATRAPDIQRVRFEYDGARTRTEITVDEQAEETHGTVSSPTGSRSARFDDDRTTIHYLPQPDLSAHPVTYEIDVGNVWNGAVETERITVHGPQLSIANVDVETGDHGVIIVTEIANDGDVSGFATLSVREDGFSVTDDAAVIDPGETHRIELQGSEAWLSEGYLSLGLFRGNTELDSARIDPDEATHE